MSKRFIPVKFYNDNDEISYMILLKNFDFDDIGTIMNTMVNNHSLLKIAKANNLFIKFFKNNWFKSYDKDKYSEKTRILIAPDFKCKNKMHTPYFETAIPAVSKLFESTFTNINIMDMIDDTIVKKEIAPVKEEIAPVKEEIVPVKEESKISMNISFNNNIDISDIKKDCHSNEFAKIIDNMHRTERNFAKLIRQVEYMFNNYTISPENTKMKASSQKWSDIVTD